MTIRPISAVTNNYLQPAFEGKKREKPHHNNHVTNTLKAIPLATLLAMSPLTNISAQEPKSKIFASVDVSKEYNEDGKKVTFLAISTDGDDSDFEVGKLQIQSQKTKNFVNKNTGQEVKGTKYITDEYVVKELKLIQQFITNPEVAEYISAFYPALITEQIATTGHIVFRLSGPYTHMETAYMFEDGTLHGDAVFKEYEEGECGVNSSFFDEMRETMGDKAVYKEETVNVNDLKDFIP